MLKVIIGIDEVGRGPLAGPIVVAAVAIPLNIKLARLLQSGHQPLRLYRRGKKFWLKDSKKLTPHQRLICYQHLKNHSSIQFAIARVSSKMIDQINIAKAANRAVYRAYKKLNCSGRVLLDGGLKLPPKIKHRTIIRGDQKYNAIKLASIVAKVDRDKIMVRLHKRYPHYAFNEHKGYGTKKHLEALKKYGACPEHRQTFLTNFQF